MRAAVVAAEGVEIKQVAEPAVKSHEILVQVRATSLNRADLLVASGHTHGPLGGVGARIGLECAGDVVAVGNDVKSVAIGDRVMGAALGSHAERVVMHSNRAHRIADRKMTYEQAACLPIALQTMHNAIITAGRLKKGESLLIQGASSGVGLMAMEIGKLMGASIVMGTSTRAERRARLKEFGCDVALDSTDANWPSEVKKATNGKGVDLIIDQVSGSAMNQNLEASATLGRIVNVGRLGGMTGSFDFDKHALKRIDYIGVTFRTRTDDEVGEINKLMRADLWPSVESGRLTLPIDQTFPFERIADGLQSMKANNHFGKIVIAF